MNLSAIITGFVEHIRSQQFISDTQAAVLRFDSASTFTDAEDSARVAPGFAYVVGLESVGNDYVGQNPPPLLRLRTFISCLHAGLAGQELNPLEAVELATSVHATTYLAEGRQVQVWLTSDAVDLTATIPMMEYTIRFELIAS
jgi:hypothetical protein